MTTTFTANEELVRRHVDRWADRVARRIRAHDPDRPAWDRKRFLLELWEDCPDYPGAVELADKFQAAVDEAHGNSARFRAALHAAGSRRPSRRGGSAPC